MSNLRENQRQQIKSIEWATLNALIAEEYGCLLVPEKKWEEVTNELESRLTDGEKWNDNWDI